MTDMQFGVFSTGFLDEQPPGTDPTRNNHQTIRDAVLLAQHAEDVGLDVFALGEHHNPPFWSSSPAVALSFIAAKTTRLQLSTAMTLITTNDPVRIAEEYALLQHLAGGRLDLMLGRGNTRPAYRWFGQDQADGIALAAENYDLLRKLWREEDIDWTGVFRSPLQRFTSVPRPLDGVPPFVWHAGVRSPETAEQAAVNGDGFFANNLFTSVSHFQRLVALYRQRYEYHGHGSAAQAIVGLGGQVFVRPRSQDALDEFRPYFRATSFGRNADLEEYIRQTPLAVGSPQQVVERYASMREVYGDYQRQLFLLNLPGMPLTTSLEQLDALGEVVRSLRDILGRGRPANVPGVPQHPTASELARL